MRCAFRGDNHLVGKSEFFGGTNDACGAEGFRRMRRSQRGRRDANVRMQKKSD